MDRFVGQNMCGPQLERIRRYYIVTPPSQRPLWSIGLDLISGEKEQILGFAYPWDFGLRRDYEDFLEARVDKEVPFREWPLLWQRLEARRLRLADYEHPPHELGLISPLPAPGVPIDAGAVASSSAHPTVAPIASPDRDGGAAGAPAPMTPAPCSGGVYVSSGRFGPIAEEESEEESSSSVESAGGSSAMDRGGVARGSTSTGSDGVARLAAIAARRAPGARARGSVAAELGGSSSTSERYESMAKRPRTR